MRVFWTKFALDTLHDIYEFYKNNASVVVANNIKESILLSTRQLENEPIKYKILNKKTAFNRSFECCFYYHAI